MSDLDGLPKVEGLENLVKDSITDNGQQTPQQQQVAAPDDGQADADLEGILKNFSTPDGKVRTKDLLKSYKEIQGFTTKVSQENAQYKEEMAKMREQLEVMQFQRQAPQQPQQPQDWNQMFIDNPEQAIAMKANEIATTRMISDVIMEEQLANPQEFNTRLAYVKNLSMTPQLAPLANSAKGVKKLFEIADKQRSTDLQRNAREAAKMLFGEDVDIEALKAVVKKDKEQSNSQTNNLNLNAYMPDTSTSNRTGMNMNSANADIQRQIQEATQKGDVSAVTRLTLMGSLNK